MLPHHSSIEVSDGCEGLHGGVEAVFAIPTTPPTAYHSEDGFAPTRVDKAEEGGHHVTVFGEVTEE